MKNRKMLYVLFALTLFVWGLIVFRVFATINKGDKKVGLNYKSYSLTSEAISKDTVILHVDYTDPFLDRPMLLSKDNRLNTSANSGVFSTQQVRKDIQWPVIRYGGLIINKKNKKVLYMVQVDGQNQLLKQGEKFRNVLLLKVSPDSIIVRFKNHSKAVKKEII